MTPAEKQGGVLHVVATPIGNLEDITYRAVRVLAACSLVLAEDTRKFKILAGRYSIPTPAESFFEHNEEKKTPAIIARLLAGEEVALVSEAGTPTISDPGYRLIKACREAGVRVEALPGPCAAVAALSISGLPTNNFFFHGFLPVKPGKRRKVLAQAVARSCPSIFYESPHRIAKAVQELSTVAPAQIVFLARELTKLHEETFYGTAEEAAAFLGRKNTVKGEFVLITRGGGDASTDIGADNSCCQPEPSRRE